jgi:hypothetical protein
MDVQACKAILHDPDYEVVDLGGYFRELEKEGGLSLPEVHALIERLLFVNRGPRHLELRRAALAGRHRV